jgi:hypothetical protein
MIARGHDPPAAVPHVYDPIAGDAVGRDLGAVEPLASE